jgi:hypothetical protein
MKNVVFLTQEFTESLNALYDLDKVPVAAAYKISKIIDDVARANKKFDELRVKLAEKYCDRHEKDDEEKGIKAGDPVWSEDGKSFTFTDEEKIKEFNDEFNDLLNVEWKPSETLTIAELGKNCELKPKYLMVLETLFSDLTKERERKDREEKVKPVEKKKKRSAK